MSCNICGQKSMNCDCTQREREQAETIEELHQRIAEQNATTSELLESTKSLLALCERYLGPLLAGGEMTKARAAIAKAMEEVS